MLLDICKCYQMYWALKCCLKATTDWLLLIRFGIRFHILGPDTFNNFKP